MGQHSALAPQSSGSFRTERHGTGSRSAAVGRRWVEAGTNRRVIRYRPSTAGRGRFQHEYVILDFAADLTPVNPDDRMARNCVPWPEDLHWRSEEARIRWETRGTDVCDGTRTSTTPTAAAVSCPRPGLFDGYELAAEIQRTRFH